MDVDRYNKDQFDDLLDKKSIEELISLSEQQIQTLHFAYGEGQLSADGCLIEKLVGEVRSNLSLLKKASDELFLVLQRLSASDELINAQIITVLSAWLDNIQRMRRICRN